MTLALALAAPACAQHEAPPDLVEMPADIPPHHKNFIATDRHYEIDAADNEIHHCGDHWISYGQHNYEMSDDPSNRERFPYDSRRFRGMGLGDEERYSIMRRDLEDIDHHPERPWVVNRIGKRGLAYAVPPENEVLEYQERFVGFPRPSWYAIYKKGKRIVRE